MNGRDFVEIASHLESVAGEASLRTQTSRLYYAAFLEARAWCEAFPGYQRSRSGAEHGKVASLFQSIDADLTASLSFLRGLSNDADYEMALSSDTLTRQRQDTWIRATGIIARLDELGGAQASVMDDPATDNDPDPSSGPG